MKKAVEMTVYGRRGKPKAGFPRRPQPLEIGGRFPHSHRLELSRGKVESQQQASHFSTALRFPFGEQNEQKQKEASLAELRSFRLIVGL